MKIRSNFQSTLSILIIYSHQKQMRDGWGLARASSNTPALVLRMEAKTEQRLTEIKDYFRDVFKKYPEIAPEWENE